MIIPHPPSRQSTPPPGPAAREADGDELAARCRLVVSQFETFVRAHPHPDQPVLIDGRVFVSLKLALSFVLWLERTGGSP